MDGNSIEAVHRPDKDTRSNCGGTTVSKSVVSKPTLAMLENGSAVSKASTAKSAAKSHTSKAMRAPSPAAPSERGGSAVSSREIQHAPPQQTYTVHHHTTQKTEDGKAAKTIVGSLIGAAAGAAIAYAMSKGDSESNTSSPPQSSAHSAPQEFRQLPSPESSPASSQYQGYRAIEAPQSVYSHAESRPPQSRSVTSKNPWATTVYEGTEFGTRGPKGSLYYDEGGRRSSEGSLYNQSEAPFRAIEYPSGPGSYYQPADMGTLISSFRDKSRISDKGSVHSASTVKPIKSHHSQQNGSHHSIVRSQAGSKASSTRTARQVPLPEGSTVSYSSYRTPSKAASKIDEVDVDTNVTPDDSISQAGDPSSRRSSHSRRSHHSHKSHASSRSNKFEEPVRPSDSASQVSSHVSRRTAKAGGSVAGGGGGSKAGSKMSSSRRGSQAA